MSNSKFSSCKTKQVVPSYHNWTLTQQKAFIDDYMVDYETLGSIYANNAKKLEIYEKLGKKYGFEHKYDALGLWIWILCSDDGEAKAYQAMKIAQWFRTEDQIVDDIDPIDPDSEARNVGVVTLNWAEEEYVNYCVDFVQNMSPNVRFVLVARLLDIGLTSFVPSNH